MPPLADVGRIRNVEQVYGLVVGGHHRVYLAPVLKDIHVYCGCKIHVVVVVHAVPQGEVYGRLVRRPCSVRGDGHRYNVGRGDAPVRCGQLKD